MTKGKKMVKHSVPLFFVCLFVVVFFHHHLSCEDIFPVAFQRESGVGGGVEMSEMREIHQLIELIASCMCLDWGCSPGTCS